ncbi:hypothetical protein [Pseudomarimonas arenosa]|uniref:DUF4405 domain-containing protein n=1 Tax=Pseudomarimonas arenosa TaxID=2774145 RepID=A0AAW3ZD39_9GAMM|nr:hypothetical protein [Pseudomarimonas arenosa]MBD8524163.1 hypothetical protein [Pseudomarimonas arenosa]
MPWVRVRMPGWLRRLLYAVLAGSWLTGTTFFILSRFVEVEGEFGPMKHPWQSPVLAAHGACAFLMLLALGALWTNHVPSAWRSGSSRRLGILLLVITACMVISGWVLYYLAGETLRPWIGNLHFALGAALPLIVASHVVLGRRARRARMPSGLATPPPRQAVESQRTRADAEAELQSS